MPGNQKPRQRKHRGTQTGSVTRAQKSRPRSRQEAMAQARSRKAGAGGKGAPVDRRDLAPTWRSAVIRGILFAALLFPISLLFNQPVGGALVLVLIAAVCYVPLGYYTEGFFYRRRLAKKQRDLAARQAENGRKPG
ncbi:MAG: hypothetical protein ABIZ50_04685 [Solirubrobacterales bacterium]